MDWRYLRDREESALQQEAGWIQRQGLRIVVDLSPGLNLYPTLRLVDNLSAEYANSMAQIADVLDKMPCLGAADLILSLHRHPENNFSGRQTEASFVQTLRTLAEQAADRKVTLHLRTTFGKPPSSLTATSELLDHVGAPNLRLAAGTALLQDSAPSADMAQLLQEKLGLWLLAGARAPTSPASFGMPTHRCTRAPRGNPRRAGPH